MTHCAILYKNFVQRAKQTSNQTIKIMKKELKYGVEIQSQNARYTNTLKWTVQYELKRQASKEEINMIEGILKQAIKFAIENAFKKDFMYRFKIHGIRIIQSFDGLNQTVERERKLMMYTKLIETKCEITGLTPWCKKKILAEALIGYFKNYYTYLHEIASYSSELLKRLPNWKQLQETHEKTLRKNYENAETLTDNVAKTSMKIT